jgi:hypothetical protein
MFLRYEATINAGRLGGVPICSRFFMFSGSGVTQVRERLDVTGLRHATKLPYQMAAIRRASSRVSMPAAVRRPRILAIHVGERRPVLIAHNEVCVGLFGGPWRREAALVA